MKRLSGFAIILCVTLLIFAFFAGVFMTSKVTFTEFSDIEKEIGKLATKKIIVGVVADENSLLAKYAAANEFGATIKPKKGQYISIPVHPEAKGKAPGDFSGLNFVPGKHKGYAFLVRGSGLAAERMFILKRSVKIPERAFIRTALDKRETQEKAYNVARAALERILGGGGRAEDLCNAIGQSVTASIKNNIASNLGHPNSELTSSLKGGGKTLIDSGDLLKSINYTVEG